MNGGKGAAARRWGGLFLTLVLLLGLATVGATMRLLLGDRELPRVATIVTVPRGASTRQIAEILARAGVVRSPLLFELAARLNRAQGTVQAGRFRLPARETPTDVLRTLQSGTAQTATWVTFPEGFTAHEIAGRLAERGLGAESVLETTFLHETLTLGGVRTPNLEGYLYPDSYLVPTETSPEGIARILTDAFRAHLPADATARAKRLGLTVPEIVTLASLVEREGKADAERPLMAGVYYNRLRIGMPLQVDASIEYALPRHATAITYADLRLPSPYNTYLHPGLPPTPIANPGNASLHAAFFPKSSAYLYYVYKGDGKHAFARTLAEHQANVRRYLHD